MEEAEENIKLLPFQVWKNKKLVSVWFCFVLNPLCAGRSWLEQEARLCFLKQTLEQCSLCPMANRQLLPNNLIQPHLRVSPGQQHLHEEYQPCENFAFSFEAVSCEVLTVQSLQSQLLCVTSNWQNLLCRVWTWETVGLCP